MTDRGAIARGRDRALAWILTGPLGRLAAFFVDLGAAWWRWATARLRGRDYP